MKKTKILDQLNKTRNPYDVVRALLDVKLSEVRDVMKSHDLDDLSGWGKTSLQPHIISRRHANERYWPTRDLTTIMEHRRLHDQGRVTMCQARDGDYILQYAIPSKRPLKRAPYFHGG